MAATTEMNGRIESGLYALTAEVEDLPNVVEEWDALPEWNQASITLDWSHLLCDYLTELDRFFRADQMTVIQAARYRQLLWKMTDALPLFERLGLLPIPVSLTPDEDAAPRARQV